MLATIFDKVVKGGPWALVVIIMLTWLAGDYGLLESRSRKAVELIEEHERIAASDRRQSQQTQQEILHVLKEQRAIQTQAALLACLRGAKSDPEREDCVRRFPIK